MTGDAILGLVCVSGTLAGCAFFWWMSRDNRRVIRLLNWLHEKNHPATKKPKKY